MKDDMDISVAPMGGIDRATGDAAGRTTLALVETLKAICAQIRVLEAEIGDARGRYPTADAPAALAGACPSTRTSGRHHVVNFRWACDKKPRDATMDLAGDPRHACPWATSIYHRHRPLEKSRQHTVRILARAGIRVTWRCWQDGVAYDPTLHGGTQTHLATAS